MYEAIHRGKRSGNKSFALSHMTLQSSCRIHLPGPPVFPDRISPVVFSGGGGKAPESWYSPWIGSRNRLFAFCMGNGALSEVVKCMSASPARRSEDGEARSFARTQFVGGKCSSPSACQTSFIRHRMASVISECKGFRVFPPITPPQRPVRGRCRGGRVGREWRVG